MKRILTTLALILGLCPNAALADFNATAGSGLVVFGFTCFSTKVCTAWVPINSAGTELFTSGNPGAVAVPSWAGGTLGAMANYGTSPGAVLVPGVNSFITNVPAVSQSGTWNVTNISGTVSLPTGAATSANQGLLTTWAGGTLGAMANYGANPGSVLVPGVNAATAPSAYLTTLSAWSSGTAGNATQSLMSSGGWPAITVQLNQTSTISGGAVTFEGTYDGTNWVSIPVAQILNPNTLANLTNPYTLVQSTNQPFLILTQGYQQVRVRLSTTITGSGTVTPFVALLPTNPTIAGILSPIIWPTTVPPVKIDQTTFGTTNGVVSAANTYQAVAASQTATVLQTSTGATGDYLSHCIIYPTSTSPGVVTVFDNTNTAATSAILFAGGPTSTSNLSPITVPVGAKSTAGAWKVTTGAAVSVVCVGKFS